MNAFWIAAVYGLAVMLAMGFVTWFYSLYRKNVNIVDSLWSLMFLAGAIILIYCMLAIIGTIMSDILLAWLDPRIRMEEG